MKIFQLFLSVLLLTPSLYAEPKNLAVQDVDFEYVRDQNTVRVRVAVQKDQFVSVKEKNDSKYEIRFYVQKASDKGSAPRIMDKTDYYLNNPVSSYTLSPKQACPTDGNYRARIWLSVRHSDSGKPNKNYNNYDETYNYTCYKDKAEKLVLAEKYKLSDSDKDDVDDQLNLTVEADADEWKNISKSSGYVAIELYALRDGAKFRVNKDKKYEMKSAKASYTASIKKVCGDMDLFDSIFGKDVEVSCSAKAVTKTGEVNTAYLPYQCSGISVTCVSDWLDTE